MKQGIVGKLLIICGPSGCGKSTLIGRMMNDWPNRFGFRVSHTSRAPRGGEVHNQHYIFSDLDTMKGMVERHEFLEHAMVHSNMYGTSFASLDSVLKTGQVCILDMDIQGVLQVKDVIKSGRHPDMKVSFVMIVPPSIDELAKRLNGRGTDAPDVIAKRLKRAEEEIKYRDSDPGFWDLVLLNDNLDSCYESLKNFVQTKILS